MRWDETPAPAEPAPRPASRRTRIGLAAFAVALAAMFLLSMMPSGFVIEQPGPVFNTLGTAPDGSGAQIPLITVEDAESYPPAGALNLTTVTVSGNREYPKSWFDVATAWFDPTRAVLPVDAVFPRNISTEQRNAQDLAAMTDSQQQAVAAALRALGYQVTPEIVVDTVPDGPSSGILEPGDVLQSANGAPITTLDQLRQGVAAGGGGAVTLGILRAGERKDVSIVPTQQDGRWILGITLLQRYDVPIDVTLQLNNVGGPSAGLMFALGVYDTLTPGDLTGGVSIAGTGTISGDGTVGRIGGIRQKMYGAKAAGSDWFLAPAGNCDEVVGNVPAGMTAVRVSTLDEALHAVRTIASGQGTDALPRCTAP